MTNYLNLLLEQTNELGRKKKRDWYLCHEEFQSIEARENYLANPVNETKELYINPYTIDNHIKHIERKYYRKAQVDITWNCNISCSYCDFKFDSKLNTLSIKKLNTFLFKHVIGFSRINIGSYAEPTMNKKLIDYIQLIQDVCPPDDIFNLQTNGLLLNHYDPIELENSGINLLSISIDALKPEIQALVRDNSNVGNTFRNIAKFSDKVSKIHLRLVSVVTQKSINDVVNLVQFAIGFGITIFTIRHVLIPKSKPEIQLGHKIIKNSELCITLEQFLYLKKDLLEKFGTLAEFEFSTLEQVELYKRNKDQSDWVVKTWK